MNVLGVNLSNNGSICLLKDGEVDFYLEAERINRDKYSNDVSCLVDYVDDVDVLAFVDAQWNDERKRYRSSSNVAAFRRKFPGAPVHDLRLDHHLAHAMCAFHRSPFGDAVNIVVDSNGSMSPQGIEIESIYRGLEPVHKKYFTEDDPGNGKMFEGACKHYGFGWMDAGKVMGLAAYGDSPALEVQEEWEKRSEELVHIAAQYSNNITLSGGCFLNCVVNYKLTKKFPHLNFYAEPLAHDGGTAIGAAYIAYYETKNS